MNALWLKQYETFHRNQVAGAFFQQGTVVGWIKSITFIAGTARGTAKLLSLMLALLDSVFPQHACRNPCTHHGH